ncbi:MAG: aminotransferase class V-fold PLP-dependent enzyme [Syntrophomonas sp.]
MILSPNHPCVHSIYKLIYFRDVTVIFKKIPLQKKSFAPQRFREDIAGVNQKVPIGKRQSVPYIYFDNAASTPALKPVLREVNDLFNWYSGVHRGTGYKSLYCSRVYDDCHDTIARFVKADLDHDTVILVKNTTEAINKLSYRLAFKPGDIVISTFMEHHSNDLPWRRRGQVKYVEVDQKGMLDLSDLEKKLKSNYPRVKLLTVCGASNVTGHINPIHHLAEIAHGYGAEILVDGAQLVPHQAVDVKPANHPQHIDYLAFSGHKIYAPFGTGVLIGPRKTFSQGEPEYTGGGTISMVTSKEVYWAGLPDREEAGSPNLIGAFALARGLTYLEKTGMENLAGYEEELTNYAMEQLGKLPGIKIYGAFPRVGVISFNLPGIGHALVGSILCLEAGIGVRTGCFCAQPYVRKLLGIKEDPGQVKAYLDKDVTKLPGMVRISLGAYNTRKEVDVLIKILKSIIVNKEQYRSNYKFSKTHGHYVPRSLLNKFRLQSVHS